MQPLKIFYTLILSLVLTACSGGGGGGGGGGGTPSPAPTGSADLKFSEYGYWFGIVDLSATKSVTITITNQGTGASKPLTFSGLSNVSFPISNNTCAGSSLAANASCSFTVSTSLSSYTSITGILNIAQSGVSNSTKTLNFAVKSYNYKNTMDNNAIIDSLAIYQNNDGSYNESTGFDMGMTLSALKGLMEAKTKLNLTSNVYTGGFGVNLGLNYLLTVDDDGSGPNPSRNLDLTADRNLVIPQWTRTTAMKLKEVQPSMLLYADKAIFSRDGTHPTWSAQVDNYLDSRRMTTSSSSMMAQYAYIMDENRWRAEYGNSYVDNNYNLLAEMALRDVYILLDGLQKAGKTTEATQLSNAIVLNFLSTSDEIFNETGVRLQYSSVEFNHTAFTQASIPKQLFVQTATCRSNAYVLLLLSKAIKSADFNLLNVLLDNTALKSDLELNLGNFIWSSLKDWIDNNRDGRDNCIPLAALAASQAPRSAVPANSYLISLYNEVFTKLDTNGGDAYNPSGAGSLSTWIEAVWMVTEGVNN